LGGASRVLLYFSASWCPPCQRFTPLLVEYYSAAAAASRKKGAAPLRVVLISGDLDRPDFDRYVSSMPWLAVPFDRAAEKYEALMERFAVASIPTVLQVGTGGEFIASNLREEIAARAQRAAEERKEEDVGL
jgi:nucleoredoxin